MPASTLSSGLSWAAYLGAAFSLCIALTPPLSAIALGSREGAALRVVDGIVSVIDGLRPGISAHLSFGSPGSSGGVALNGRNVTYTDGRVAVSRTAAWLLPQLFLAPGKSYGLQLDGETVEVMADG